MPPKEPTKMPTKEKEEMAKTSAHAAERCPRKNMDTKPAAAGDASADKKKDDKEKEKGKGKAKEPEPEPEPEELPKTPSQVAREEAEFRAMLRKERFKRRWPEVTAVKVRTRPWTPPPPPQRMPPVVIKKPHLKLCKWFPPEPHRERPRLARIPPEEVTQPLYECAKLKKIWHSFVQVEKNKMMLQGTVGCNSKRYSSTACGAQTACIAVVCCALLEEKTPAQLVRRDVDAVIEAGDRYYKQCMIALKCYKGKPQLQLNQLLPSFFLHDTKYTVKMAEVDRGLLARHPDNLEADPDLMALMEKRIGMQYLLILSVGSERHFLVWGEPPEQPAQVKTIAYIFDPHMLDDMGHPNNLVETSCGCWRRVGAGAFLRYAGVSSFVVDFLAHYGNLDSAKKGASVPPITLTSVEVVQKEPLLRVPKYDLDMKALKAHCMSEWNSMNINALIEKRKEGQYPLGSLSAVSLATSRATTRRKVKDFYQKTPKEPAPQVPIPPERPPPPPTYEQIMSVRGEDFFLYTPSIDAHTYGRDDLIPRPKSETVLHSYVEIADQNFHSQFQQMDAEKWILRGTRHMASFRYQRFKWYTGIPCCVAALGMLRRLRARGWNEDTLDETLDVGFNLYRESLLERGGPIRALVLGELRDAFRIRDREYLHKERGVAVWGKLISNNPKVLDLYRGVEAFFKEADTGLLQIPGEYEVAIWNEGGKFYMYHPWPADRSGQRIGLREGGRACLLYFTRISRLCEQFLESAADMKRKPFSIADIDVTEQEEMPQPINKLKPVAPGRWVMRGRFHEGDERFPEERRGRQATPVAIAALAMAQLVPPAAWTPDNVDEALVRGDMLYQSTIEQLERLGISLEVPRIEEEAQDEEESRSAGTLAAADVLDKFMISEYDCIETDVMDSLFCGELNPGPGSGTMSLKQSLRQLFTEHAGGVVTARGASTAIFRDGEYHYFFDPHGCDASGLPSDEALAAACLVRLSSGVEELANVIMGNLPPGPDDSFNISPVTITATKLNPEIGAPETKLESQAYEWIKKGTAAVLDGPRGENTAIGKAAEKGGIGEEDMAGRNMALPAAAAFLSAAECVPPPHMHRDHIYNFLDAGVEYYLNHLKKTGRKEMVPEDLTEKFEMGANTFWIELGEYIRLPLRLPDEPVGEGGEEGSEKEELGEGLEEEEKEEPMKQIKDALFKVWRDPTTQCTLNLLVGDYHQLGVWMNAGGKVVAFDPAPTGPMASLTLTRIKKGDELRLQRLKDEMTGEGAGGEEDDEEYGAEGEQQPEPVPDFVPPESTAVLMVFASPGEFIDKLTQQGVLDRKQCLAPYKLYPVTVKNELTSVLKEKKSKGPREEAGDAGGDEEGEEEGLVEAIDDSSLGKYFERIGRATASVRGRVAQGESYFMEQPNRDNQDAANSVMGIVVEHIEPYVHWKPALVDAVLKYGDRLHTLSLGKASAPPRLRPQEIATEFHVTSFNVRLEIESDVVTGDIKAGETGAVLNLRRGLQKFFDNEKHGVVCCRGYCAGVWRAEEAAAYCLWEPHAVGPAGRASGGGAAALVIYSVVELLADTFRDNVEARAPPGPNRFSISSVKVFWEFSKQPNQVTPQGAVPDEGYEWKVLTAYVETARGRTILRGTRPLDPIKFKQEAILQSSCGAIVAVCMTHVRRPHLWTKNTVDQIMSVAGQLFSKSLCSLGYEFQPGEDVLLPLQVLQRFVLGVNYVRYELEAVFSGRLEQTKPSEMTVRSALEHLFESHTHGVLWSAPYAVAVWRVQGAPAFYMMEPHACGPTGLRIDALDDGAACVMTFSSAKLMAFSYLQNIPTVERTKHEFQLYAMSVTVRPIKRLGSPEPPMVRAPPGQLLVPATSKVGVDGTKRHADERDRKHPPGSATCLDAQRATDVMDKEQNKPKGHRNTSGWLVLSDGTQFLSANHSMACKKFPYASRGNQALACSVMAVAMSRVEDVCRWCSSTLDEILESGDQLYQDSYLHFKPPTKILTIEQILRKFYTPGNCVCRVVVYRARQKGLVEQDLVPQLAEFFKEEKAGVFVAGKGDFAVALFRTPRGYYMFDPADRDRYGRAVAPPCIGHARACFSQFPKVQTLAENLGPNVPPLVKNTSQNNDRQGKKVLFGKNGEEEKGNMDKEVHSEHPAPFAIYGMQVTSLRRLNKHER